MKMYTWWAFVRTGVGAFVKVTVQAPDAHTATVMLRNMYGGNLISDYAALQPD